MPSDDAPRPHSSWIAVGGGIVRLEIQGVVMTATIDLDLAGADELLRALAGAKGALTPGGITTQQAAAFCANCGASW